VIEQVLEGFRATSLPELASFAFGLLYAVLAVRRTRWCWVIGGIGAAILIVLAWRARLPGQAALQVYYVAMSVYGFWHWSRDEGKAHLAVTTLPWRAHLAAWAGILVLSWVSSHLLMFGTQAAWPFLDSITVWGSLFATWLTAQVKLENWLYWIVFDAISVFLFASQKLMFIALLMLVYLVIAAVGYVTWLRSRRAPAPSV
jgi:nicotinamide mononucleotide transporter